jgi:hypothetical protein
MQNDPLNLRNLPAHTPPDDLWPSIAAALDDAPRKHARRYLFVALAASLVLAVAGLQVIDIADEHQTPSATGDSQLQLARAASARLEQLLRRQRDGVLDATAVESLAWMEQELGWLDVQLADNPSETRLWQQRADLLAEMAGQYERNNWQARIQLASY